jgi:exopolysaccharide production protein ExoQ
MAVYSKHPASAPPTAPVRETTGHLLRRAWCIFVLFQALAGTALIHAFTNAGAAAIAIGSGAVSLLLWFLIRPPVQWRRLPEFALSYVLWAGLSFFWSAWPQSTALTLLLLGITTLQALFLGSVLTWRELVRAIASALKWIITLSILFELWVSVVVQHAVMPGFQPTPEGGVDPIEYWSRNNLFDGGRIQGIVGNANLLGPLCLLAIIVFAIRIALGAPRRVLLSIWIALAAYGLLRAASATTYLAAAGVGIVLATILLMRRAKKPGQRTPYYIGYAVIGIGGAALVFALRDVIFGAVGRDSDLTGREQIWQVVLEKANERPWIGWGYATPWVPSDPAFEGWIIDHGQTVMQAHSVWVDVYLQLGLIGVFLIALTYLAFVWRAWFFAVDRPRWDLGADRPYSPMSLLPSLVGAILLVQSFSESSPLLLWGWMFVVMFSFKIKQAPHIGVGPAEQTLAIERGELTKQAT